MRILTSVLLSALVPMVALGGPVDINTADASTLAKELNGVGPARAQAIVAYRNEHGPFKSADELRLVKNLPQKIIDSNRELLRFEGGKSARAEARGGAAKADAKADAHADGKAAPKP